MDKLTKIKFLGCGIFLAAIMGAESLPIICDECHHVSMPHLPEHNYTTGTASVVAVSGISDTATTHILPWFDSGIS